LFENQSLELVEHCIKTIFRRSNTDGHSLLKSASKINSKQLKATVAIERILNIWGNESDNHGRSDQWLSLVPAEYLPVGTFAISLCEDTVRLSEVKQLLSGKFGSILSKIRWSTADGPQVIENLVLAEPRYPPSLAMLQVWFTGYLCALSESYERFFIDEAPHYRAIAVEDVNEHIAVLKTYFPYPAALLNEEDENASAEELLASSIVLTIASDAFDQDLDDKKRSYEADSERWSAWWMCRQDIKRSKLDAAAKYRLQLFALEVVSYLDEWMLQTSRD